MIIMKHMLSRESIVVEAPASIANLGPGFDVLAMAITGLRDTVRIVIESGEGNIYVVSSDPRTPGGKGNVAYAVASKIAEKYGLHDIDIHIVVDKGIPTSAGLGGSAATSVATAYGLSRILKLGLSKRELLKFAGIGEAYVAGTPHYDNVAASLFGGIVIVDPYKLEVHVIKPKKEIWLGIVVPEKRDLGYKTRRARSILPKNISLKLYVKQSASLAKLIHAFHIGDISLLGEAISSDHIVEPYRSKLIEHYWELKKLALNNGALGFNIAGAGPSVFFIHMSRQEVINLGKKLLEHLISYGIKASFHVSTVSSQGVRVVGVRRWY